MVINGNLSLLRPQERMHHIGKTAGGELIIIGFKIVHRGILSGRWHLGAALA